VGSVDLQPGQTLQTANGKAEILLTPGVFLRLDDNSAVTMISPSLTNTQVEIAKGRAAVEVDEIHSLNNIQVAVSGANTRLLKKGFYEFDATNGTIRVFKGKAEVADSNWDSRKPITVKGGHQLALAANPPLKPASFNTKEAEDELYNWNSLRSEYLAQANADLATQYAGYSGFAPGWYWNTRLWGYTWLPGDGMFWNPFGWGFYSPLYIYGGGPIYYRRGGTIYNGYPGHPGYIVRRPGPGAFRGGMHSFSGGGFHGGAGGGFHGGGHR
jgi:hypothetical protein